jgi:hypothetical protein
VADLSILIVKNSAAAASASRARIARGCKKLAPVTKPS